MRSSAAIALITALALGAPAGASGKAFELGIDETVEPFYLPRADAFVLRGLGGEVEPHPVFARVLGPTAQRPGARHTVVESGRIVDRVATAANPTTGELLVVSYDWDQARPTDLVAQRVAGSGTRKGGRIVVSHSAARGLQVQAPAVVADPATGGWLVVWETRRWDGSRPPDVTLWSQQLDRQGRPRSARDTRVVPGAGDRAAQPYLLTWAVARDSSAGGYLLARLEPATSKPPAMVLTRRLDARGRPAGATHRAMRIFRPASTLKLAYGARHRRFLLATRVTGALRLQALTRGGLRSGPNLDIRVPRYAPDLPTLGGLEYAARSGTFLVTWAFIDDRFHAGTFVYPRGQLVGGDGTRLVGGRRAFTRDGDARRRQIGGASTAAYDSRRAEFLVLWRDWPDPNGPGSVVGERIAAH